MGQVIDSIFTFMEYNINNLLIKTIVYKINEKDDVFEFGNIIMSALPTYEDRSSSIRKTKKEVDKELLYALLETLDKNFDIKKDTFLFEQNDNLKHLKIIIHRVSDFEVNICRDNPIIKSAQRKSKFKCIVDPSEKNYTYVINYESFKESRYDNNNLRKRGLNISDIEIYELLSKSDRVMSRGDIADSLNYSDRTISYSLKRLSDRNLIQNINNNRNAKKKNMYVINDLKEYK